MRLLLLVASGAVLTHAKERKPTPAPTPPDYFACNNDTNCVATYLYIPGTHNCCWDGDLIAVNVATEQAYVKAHTCKNNSTECIFRARRRRDDDLPIPFFYEDDDVPVCVNNQCTMVRSLVGKHLVADTRVRAVDDFKHSLRQRTSVPERL